MSQKKVDNYRAGKYGRSKASRKERIIDKLENLGKPVERMVQRHVQTGVKPEHYPAVAAALLPAIRDVLGEDVATDAVLNAWGEAYWMLADILISAESAAYAEMEFA